MTPSEGASPISVLVVDDEELLARSCLQILGSEALRLSYATRGRAALELVCRQRPDIVLSDLRLPDLDGLDLLKEIRRISPETLVIVMTGFATLDSSLEALQAGAYDYIPKPFTATQLRILIGRASQQVRLRRDNDALRDQLRRHTGFTNIVVNSDAMRKVFSLVDRVASTDASVFLSGESGTGKELVARAIHARSRRMAEPFVAINCAALPDHLLESELFGYEKGAFTGANEQRQGLLERAIGGTFFLDELTEMSLDLQAKLLRVVQERRIRRVGGAEEIPIDVRWISATNRDPEQAVREGQLRQDLYFRLNVVPIRLPPLRARPDDIPVLAQDFLVRYLEEYGRPELRLTPRVLEALQAYPWPGNVRELQNLIERIVSLSAGGEVDLDEVADELSRPSATANGQLHWEIEGLADRPFHDAKTEAVAAFERAYLREILMRSGGNISRAARHAGIDRKTVHRLLAKHGLGPSI
jgi:DNA-binding NtrC family response regulator